MRRYYRTIILLLPLFCLLCMQAQAQVTIAPTALFIDEQSRFGTFLVLNGSDQTQEVNLEFIFGYPATDELGNTYMEYDDEEAEAQYSIAEWIRGFPRSFTLEPGERQTVRLTVRPPGDLPDGTYWTRIKTTSNAVSPDIDEEIQDGVSAQIAFRFEQITAGFFKKGDVNSGLEINSTKVTLDEDQATVLSSIERTGNSPFLGTMFLTVQNSAGQAVHEGSNSIAVYKDAVRRMQFDISDLTPGNYTVDLRFETTRRDIPSSDLVQADPVSAQVSFTID